MLWDNIGYVNPYFFNPLPTGKGLLWQIARQILNYLTPTPLDEGDIVCVHTLYSLVDKFI